MRQQEQGWPSDFKESRDEYKARLRRTALSLPRSVVGKAIADMQRRAQELKKAKGMYFEE